MTDAPFLILASGSPRRRDLLTEAGYRFQVENPGIEENEDTSLPIRQLTAENARDKAAAVSARFPEAIVIAAVVATIGAKEGPGPEFVGIGQNLLHLPRR